MNNLEKSKIQSFIITTIVGVLCILLLWLNLSFTPTTQNKPLAIEFVNLQESNYGNTPTGKGEEEPAPTQSATKTNQPEAQPQKEIIKNTSTPTTKEVNTKKAQVQETTKDLPTLTKNTKKTNKKPTTKSTTKAKQEDTSQKNGATGNQEANAALANILGGKGKANSNGQGNSANNGNVGDPKGNSDSGKGIGENWKTRVPKNQSHNCDTSGTVIVDIVVNANGTIKRATPRVTNSQCLANRAKELVLKYVTAFPGADGRRGSYKITLK